MEQPFYWNFDGLDVSFKGRVPAALCAVLESAKAEAAESRLPVLVEWRGQHFHVAETGAKGGYAYRIDTGTEGAVWFFSKNQDLTRWNIRVSVRSAALASRGLGRVRADLYAFLEAIGADVLDAAIARVDYCVDFEAPAFVLDPNEFVIHSRSDRADHVDDAMSIHGCSGRYTSVTVGHMPGRQVILYDKTKEIAAARKLEWWSHWNAARARQGLAPLDGSERIWRVEVRAGKRCLKDLWGVVTWADFDTKIGDVMADTLRRARLTVPSPTDTNRARWPLHPMWAAAIESVGKDLSEMSCGARPGVVKEVRRQALSATMRAMMLGLLATWTLATGERVEAAPIAASLHDMAFNYVESEREEFRQKMDRAGRKYFFICEAGDNGKPNVGGLAYANGRRQEVESLHLAKGSGAPF